MLPMGIQLWAATYCEDGKRYILESAEGAFINLDYNRLLYEMQVWGENPEEYEIIPIIINGDKNV